MALNEVEFRKKIQETFDRIERALVDEDPDQVECENSHGSLTLRVSDGSRCILSAQPSVRQLWLALAARGTAHHFGYEPLSGTWTDDKGQGLEVLTLIEKYIVESTGRKIRF